MKVESTQPPPLLTATQAARALAISPRTLWALTNKGEIEFVRVSASGVRYAPEALARFIAANTFSKKPQ
jgi:excisionase family DNA binding protein